jgi:hypothetical protein
MVAKKNSNRETVLTYDSESGYYYNKETNFVFEVKDNGASAIAYGVRGEIPGEVYPFGEKEIKICEEHGWECYIEDENNISDAESEKSEKSDKKETDDENDTSDESEKSNSESEQSEQSESEQSEAEEEEQNEIEHIEEKIDEVQLIKRKGEKKKIIEKEPESDSESINSDDF